MDCHGFHVVLAACHIGQAKALVPVASLLVQCKCLVTILLDGKQSASEAYKAGRLKFPYDCVVLVVNTGENLREKCREIFCSADRVLVALSPVNSCDTVEMNAAVVRSIEQKQPVYGYSEVVCGHLAPCWGEMLGYFEKLFVAKKTLDLQISSNAVEVGMDIPTLDRERAVQTKAMLGLQLNDPFIWIPGGPYAEAARMLACVAECIFTYRERYSFNPTVVFSRHARDKEDEYSLLAYRLAASSACSKGVRVIENSADHFPEETTEFQRKEIIPYARLFEACSLNGAVITGHGTDGLKAPYLGIPSLLCVGELNPHIEKEKGCKELPLPRGYPMQVVSMRQLESLLMFCFVDREKYAARCRELYPAQTRMPAEIIVEHLFS